MAKRNPNNVNRQLRFTDPAGTQVTPYLRQGKKGFNVAVSKRDPGAKAVTGMRSTHDTLEAATTVYEGHVEGLKAAGFTERVGRVAKDRDAFKELPTPNMTPAPAPAPKAAAPAKRKR